MTDTRDKRASALSGLRVIYPNPSGDLDSPEQRAHMAGLYALETDGEPAPSPAVIVGGSAVTVVSVNLYSPLPAKLPIEMLSVYPRVTSVEIETQDGGWGSCRLGMGQPDSGVYPYLPRPIENVMDGLHVEVTAGSNVVFEGVIAQPRIVGGSVQGIAFAGYGPGLAHKIEYAASSTAETTALNIIRDAVSQSGGLFRLSPESVDSGARHQYSEFDGVSLGQLLSTLAAEGDGVSQWMWTCYGGNTIAFTPQRPPAIATYRIAVDERVVIESDYSGVYDTARLRDGDLLTRWFYAPGVTDANATRRITLSGGIPSMLTANTYVSTWIATHGVPVLTGTISLGRWDALRTADGATRPAYLARAGEWLDIEGFGKAQIRRTSANLTDGGVSLTLGPPSSKTLGGWMAFVEQTADAVRSGVSPVTGYRTT